MEALFPSEPNSRLVFGATFLLGICSGVIGSFLLLRKRSLIGDALSHATFPGIVLAYLFAFLLGFDGRHLGILLLGAVVSGMLGVVFVIVIRRTTPLKDDAAMGIVLSVFFGLGVVLLKSVQSIPGTKTAGLDDFIYGSTASIVFSDFLLIAGVAAFTVVICFLCFKEFALLCFDEGFAASQGSPTLILDMILLGLVTMVTVTGLQSVGLILMIAFLVIPSAAARFWTHNLPKMVVLSGVIGGVSGWFGAAISSRFADFPAGAVIVLAAAAAFFVSLIFGTDRGVLLQWLRQRRLSRRVGRQHLLRAIFEILETGGNQVGPRIENQAVSFADLKNHRVWNRGELAGLLRRAASEDHLETSAPGSVRLSESGFGEASRVTRNHRLWEMFLIKHADIAPSHVDRDADLVEHILGADMVRELEAELVDRHPPLEVPASPHELVSKKRTQ